MDVLTFVAHPDDADLFCGGAIAKHADRGDDVTIANMTRGEYGGFDTTESEVAATRTAEAKQSAATLGAETTFLGFEDGRVTYSLENRLRVLQCIRNHAPDIVITHFDDDMHPDTRVTSRLVTDAYYMASLPLVDIDQPPCDSDNVYFLGKPTSSFEPSIFVDISDSQSVKESAIEAHESQVKFLDEHGGIDAEFDNLVKGVRAEARTLGKRTGVDHAEGFAPLHETTTAYLGEQ